MTGLQFRPKAAKAKARHPLGLDWCNDTLMLLPCVWCNSTKEKGGGGGGGRQRGRTGRKRKRVVNCIVCAVFYSSPETSKSADRRKEKKENASTRRRLLCCCTMYRVVQTTTTTTTTVTRSTLGDGGKSSTSNSVLTDRSLLSTFKSHSLTHHWVSPLAPWLLLIWLLSWMWCRLAWPGIHRRITVLSTFNITKHATTSRRCGCV